MYIKMLIKHLKNVEQVFEKNIEQVFLKILIMYIKMLNKYL